MFCLIINIFAPCPVLADFTVNESSWHSLPIFTKFQPLAFFKYGYVIFITYEPVPETHALLNASPKDLTNLYPLPRSAESRSTGKGGSDTTCTRKKFVWLPLDLVNLRKCCRWLSPLSSSFLSLDFLIFVMRL